MKPIKTSVPILLAVAALLAAPLTGRSLTTVFNDTFGSGSTLTNASPAWPTINSTAYEEISSKSFSGGGGFIGANHLKFGCVAGGTSGAEIEALFTTTPVTLSTVGDYVQLTVVFTNLATLTNTAGSQLAFGMFNSGQVKPFPGGINGTANTSSNLTGYAQTWVGYNGQYASPGTSKIFTRTNQNLLTTANNQDLLLTGSSSASYAGATQITGAASATSFTLTVGGVYTEVFTIMMIGANTNSLAITNTLYSGTDTSGTVIAQYGGIATNATAANNLYLTNSFDSLAIGYRGSTQGGALLDISNITVVASVANAPTAPGPTFGVSGGGLGCPGDLVPVSLSGSVITNTYWLYTNNVFSGVISNGTGNPITFNSTVQTVSVTNTIVASNTVNAVTGPMSGSAVVAPYPAPAITTQLASVIVATNSVGVFAVIASGNGLSYQWHRNGTSLTDGGHIAGSTTATLVISPATTADAFSGAQGYYCTVSNACGVFVNSTTNSLTLDVSANIVWQGGNPSNIWNVATSPNFTNSAGAAVNFNNGDNVTLDDSSTYPIIKAVGYVAPGILTDTASANNYVIAASSSALTGPGSLVMSGTGTTLTISNANSFTGGSTLNSGTVGVQNLAALGTGGVTLSGGTLDIAVKGSSSGGFSNNITVTANSTLQYDATGTTYNCMLNGSLTGTGGTTLNVYFANNNSANVGRVRLYGIFTNNANIVLSSAGAVAELAPYNPANGDQVYNGIISGSGHLCARNTGNLVLNATNTFNDTVNGYSFIMSGGDVGLGADSVSSTPPTIDASPVGIGAVVINCGNIEDNASGSPTFFAVGGPRTLANPIYYSTSTNLIGLTLSGSNALTLSGAFQLSIAADTAGTNRTIQVNNTAPSTLSGVISDNSKASGIIKTGTGALYLNGVNTYTGDTTDTAGLLAGTGTIAGNVIVNSGASLGGGDNTGIGTLTISGNLTLNGNAFIRLNKSLAPQSNDVVTVTGSLTNSGTGTLTVTNLGVPALAIGDSFKIFSGAVSNGAAITVSGGGMNWNNKLAIDGSIQALSVASALASYSTNITASVINGGTTLNVTWPATHLGWELMVQTNTLAGGLGKNWVTNYGTASVTSTNLTINPNNGAVFYKLVHP